MLSSPSSSPTSTLAPANSTSASSESIRKNAISLESAIAQWAVGGDISENRTEARKRISHFQRHTYTALDLTGLHLKSLPTCLEFLPPTSTLIVDSPALCSGLRLPADCRITTNAELFLSVLNSWAKNGTASENRAGAKEKIFSAWLPAYRQASAPLDLTGLNLESVPKCLHLLPKSLVVHIDRPYLCNGVKMPNNCRVILHPSHPKVIATDPVQQSTSGLAPVNIDVTNQEYVSSISARNTTGDTVTHAEKEPSEKLPGNEVGINSAPDDVSNTLPSPPDTGHAGDPEKQNHSAGRAIQVGKGASDSSTSAIRLTPSSFAISGVGSGLVESSTQPLRQTIRTAEAPAPSVAGAKYHPHKTDSGKMVEIHVPTIPSAKETWHDPKEIAVFPVGAAVPDSICGIPMVSWTPPKDCQGWIKHAGKMRGIGDPEAHDFGPRPRAGVTIVLPDNRVIVIEPTNQFFAARTFPKGGVDKDLRDLVKTNEMSLAEALRITALKETYEETGLRVELVGHLDDFQIANSKYRMFVAKLIGGTFKDMGWETQAVSAVPPEKLSELLEASNASRLSQRPARKSGIAAIATACRSFINQFASGFTR